MSGMGKVKNKSAAPIQITAEQLIREATIQLSEASDAPVKQHIADMEELQEFQLTKRQRFEDTLRMKRGDVNTWMRYARFEESQGEIDRSRSIYERAIDTDYRQPMFWLKYAEMEMRNKFVNHARNVFDRAVTLLPREDLLWFRYVFMEEKLGNFGGTRRLFERWMEWEPEVTAWEAYIKFELRYGEVARSRALYARFVVVHPSVQAYLRWTKFEQENGEIANARSVYEMGVDILGADATLLSKFAQFEAEDAKEVERARAIYRYALDRVSEESAAILYRSYVAFEKQNGNRDGIEAVIAGKRRMVYEEELNENPRNYDCWFDYAQLEEKYGTVEVVRELYERAISNVPESVTEKRYWRRYIYLWIRYAMFEELDGADVGRARAVYSEMLSLIPHQHFSFTKAWTMFALFEVRQRNLAAARKIFGMGLGRAPKPGLFQNYIDLEVRLAQTDRARLLFEKYVTVFPGHSPAWIAFAELEAQLHEDARVRAIFELAVSQDTESPELVWKAYLDYEIEQQNYPAVESLYRRLLERTQHPRVWGSFASFLRMTKGSAASRSIYQEGFEALKGDSSKEERYQLLELWKHFEQELGTEGNLVLISECMPKRVKKRRKLYTVSPDGRQVESGQEEYWDYIFPDAKAEKPNLKLLEMAHAWKKKKTGE